MPSLIVIGDGELDRLVDHDAVAVEKPSAEAAPSGSLAIAARSSSAAPLRMAAKASVTRRGAEARAQLLDARRAHLRHRDLRVHVAAHQLGLAAVGEDDALDVGQRAGRPRRS